jgi:hypothetical protein
VRQESVGAAVCGEPELTSIDWTAVAAVGTLAAVAVALFRDPFLSWWARPRLKLQQLGPARLASSKSPKPHELGNRIETWQLMAVANEGRSRTADDVQVLALEVARLGGAQLDSIIGAPVVKNYALKWSLLPTRSLSIAAGTERWFDLVYAIQLPASMDPTVVRRICLPVKENPWPPLGMRLKPSDWDEEGHVLLPGAYRIHLALAGESLRARHYCVDVQLKEAGDEPDLREALTVLRCRDLRGGRLRGGGEMQAPSTESTIR